MILLSHSSAHSMLCYAGDVSLHHFAWPNAMVPCVLSALSGRGETARLRPLCPMSGSVEGLSYCLGANGDGQYLFGLMIGRTFMSFFLCLYKNSSQLRLDNYILFCFFSWGGLLPVVINWVGLRSWG